MKHLLCIRVPFKKAIKKGYPIYYHEPYSIKIQDTPINKELTKKDYTYKYDDAIFDINGKSNSRSFYLYSKIPLIYSNLFRGISGIIFISTISNLSNIKLTGNPIPLIMLFVIGLIWLNLFQYWQNNELNKYIKEQIK